MKKSILASLILGLLPLSMQAQDDMYFVPKKKAAKSVSSYGIPHDTYYSGSNRSVDEYNRRSKGGSSYEMIAGDSTLKDVITFSPVEGVYPDSLAEGGDYQLTKKMTRWDGYTPTDAYWEGYDRGRSDEWSASLWHSPWYYSSYYSWYDPWYYDPWYPSWTWRAGWYYDPWYYRPYHYYGWGWGGYYGGYHAYHPYHDSGRSSYYRPSTGTQSHGRIINSGRRYNSSGIGAGRGTYRSNSGSVGAGRTTRTTVSPSRSSGTSSVGSGRSTSGSYGSTRSSAGSSIGSSHSSGSSIGASRSSGGSVGGGRSSGGGSRSAGRR